MKFKYSRITGRSGLIIPPCDMLPGEIGTVIRVIQIDGKRLFEYEQKKIRKKLEDEEDYYPFSLDDYPTGTGWTWDLGDPDDLESWTNIDRFSILLD